MKVTQTCMTHIYHLKMANPLQKYNGNMGEKTTYQHGGKSSVSFARRRKREHWASVTILALRTMSCERSTVLPSPNYKPLKRTWRPFLKLRKLSVLCPVFVLLNSNLVNNIEKHSASNDLKSLRSGGYTAMHRVIGVLGKITRPRKA